MTGLNKQKLSHEHINKVLQVLCGCEATMIVELSDGWANSAFDLTTENGDSWIMKVSPPAATTLMRYEYELMKTEVEVLELLQQVNPFPIPKVIACDRSRSLLDGEILIMEKLSGVTYNQIKQTLTEQQCSVIERRLGEYTALLHEIKGSGFGPYCAPMNGSVRWREVFLTMINSVLDDGEEAGLPMPYQKLRDVLDNHSACMNEVSEPSLIHWDLWDGNLLIENGQITGIIDFERALWGDPLIEYYFTNASLDNTAFKKGYGRYEQLSVMEQKRVLYYRLYLNLIMYVECYYRGYSDEAHIAWASSNVKQAIASFMEEIDRER